MNIKQIILFSILVLATPTVFSQENETDSKNSFHVGIGAGLDYGGLGTKLTYTPIEEISLFGGVGYNLLSVGWNVGVSYNIKTDERLQAYPTIMYGYNGILNVKNSDYYSEISYGVSVGFNLVLKSKIDKNYWNFGIYFPFRTEEFMNKYKYIKNNSYPKNNTFLLPITLSFGYNFKL